MLTLLKNATISFFTGVIFCSGKTFAAKAQVAVQGYISTMVGVTKHQVA
jgi:hypothetical protein